MKEDNKNPKTCGYSIDFAGIYLCRLHVLPCVRVNACPLADSETFADAIIKMVDGNKDNISK